MSRRAVLAGIGCVLLVPLSPEEAQATPESMSEAMHEALGSRALQAKAGRIKLEVPELAENGNAVPLRVTVDSPMTPDDHVKSIYVFSERNPVSNVVRFHLSPRAGRATVRTNIRLAGTQRITAVAQMSDGSLWSGAANVVVTQAACIDDT